MTPRFQILGRLSNSHAFFFCAETSCYLQCFSICLKMPCVYQDRVVQATLLGGFGCSLSLSGSGALAIPELYEVYGLKMLEQFFKIILLVLVLPYSQRLPLPVSSPSDHFRMMIYQVE